jgi:hypothetical protein
MAAMRPLLGRLARHGRVATRSPWTNLQSVVASPVLARLNGCHATRAFSGKGLNGLNGLNGDRGAKDEWDEGESHADGDASPFERLLQHSEQFRNEVGLDDGSEGVEGEKELPDETEELPTDPYHDDESPDAALDGTKRDDTEFETRMHARHGRANRHANRRVDIASRIRRQIGGRRDVDFEHGLRDLNERAREKMYEQLLGPDADRDRVCHNCGEPGHVARNCMLPMICSNCGDVGHRSFECRHGSLTVDQLVSTKTVPAAEPGSTEPLKSHKQLEAEMRRREDLLAISERHERMKKAFDEELEAFLKSDKDKPKREKAKPKKAE